MSKLKVLKTGVVMIGYSGHAFVVGAAARRAGIRLAGYSEIKAVELDPLGLADLGPHREVDWGPDLTYFIAIGDNALRSRLDRELAPLAKPASAVVDPAAFYCEMATVAELSFVAAGAVVQALARVGRGAIVNSGAVVEHETVIGAFAHVGPNATLAGAVRVGGGAFIGSGSQVAPGLTVGADAILGAGSTLLEDLPAGETWVGSPARPTAASLAARRERSGL